jgi:hypothetical protein
MMLSRSAQGELRSDPARANRGQSPLLQVMVWWFCTVAVGARSYMVFVGGRS